MTRRNEPFETRTVSGHRRAARLAKQGWEIVAQSSNFLAPATITLRRPNPHYRSTS